MTKQASEIKSEPKPYQVHLKLVGVTPLQQSKEYVSTEPKQANETHNAYELRTWKLRSHVNEDGFIFHPAGALKKALEAAASYSSRQIPGQGKKTYTQKVKSGVGVVEDLVTDCKQEDVKRRDVFGASDGKSGSGGRVWKYFPTIEKWTATTVINVYDPIITEDVLMTLIEEAGRFIGLGTWRPANGGEYGRFKVAEFKVCEL